MSWLGAIAAVVVLLAVLLAYLVWYFHWEAKNTTGMAYYGRTPEGRRHFKRQVRRRSRPLVPVLRALASIGRARRTMPAVDYGGVSGPPKVSTPEAFARARQYRPEAADVFVATQMRCGTTWMQQIVYQIVTRGRGEFAGPERSHLYAISPWIEAVNSVSMADAPVLPARIIKTHLPASHCPYSAEAKYIYVARHPVSCFASIMDFNRSMVGPFVPPEENMAAWFTSDRMYWLPWPKHVDGWWQWSRRHGNVLFVHFEEMKRDLEGAIDRVASFLAVDLTADERRIVASRCTFAYMKDHEEWFEMAPPTMFSVAGGRFVDRRKAAAFLTSGSEKRDQDVTPAIRAQILDYCRRELIGSAYPAGQFYQDLAD
jgi:hypothetical protein